MQASESMLMTQWLLTIRDRNRRWSFLALTSTILEASTLVASITGPRKDHLGRLHGMLTPIFHVGALIVAADLALLFSHCQQRVLALCKECH
jgi:hypothetical protein